MMLLLFPGSIGTDSNGRTYWRRRRSAGPPPDKRKPPPMGVGRGGSSVNEQRTQYTAFDPRKQHQACLAAIRAKWIARRYPAAGATAHIIAPFLFPGETEVGGYELTDEEEAELPTSPVPF
jgi:hypothetical protein